MKRTPIVATLMLLFLVLCLSACAKESHKNLLEFPGLKWGMTPEEVQEALDISEDTIVSDKLDADEPEFTISGRQYFGSNTVNIEFRFCKFSNNSDALYKVILYYPEETDMAVIRDNLIKIYGPGTDYGFTDYALDEGTLQSYINWNRGNHVQYGATIEENAKRPTPIDEIIHRWSSTGNGKELFDDDTIEKAVEIHTKSGYAADRETLLEYLEKHVWVRILCTDRSEVEEVVLPYVCFNAEHIVFSSFVDRHANK